MIDEGVVVSADGRTARVKVEPATACGACSARTLCRGRKGEDGSILTLNPLRARPGDRVTVEIPEEAYATAAIRLFGGLLVAALLGCGLGALAGILARLSVSAAAFVGFLIGLAAGGYALCRSYGRSDQRSLYPVVSSVSKEGEFHG